MQGNGHTYRAAAALVGTSHVSVQRYCRGSIPPVDVCIRLREVAGIPVASWARTEAGGAS